MLHCRRVSGQGGNLAVNMCQRGWSLLLCRTAVLPHRQRDRLQQHLHQVSIVSLPSSSYFLLRNIGYSGGFSTGGTCSHRIRPSQQNICQFRLDFLTLDLVKPNNIDGQCETDTITFTEVGGDDVSVCWV